VIGPGIGGCFVSDFGGFERNGGISRTIEAFRAFLADAQAPGGSVAKGKEEDGIVS
jgi:hypothetical protein